MTRVDKIKARIRAIDKFFTITGKDTRLEVAGGASIPISKDVALRILAAEKEALQIELKELT